MKTIAKAIDVTFTQEEIDTIRKSYDLMMSYYEELRNLENNDETLSADACEFFETVDHTTNWVEEVLDYMEHHIG